MGKITCVTLRCQNVGLYLTTDQIAKAGRYKQYVEFDTDKKYNGFQANEESRLFSLAAWVTDYCLVSPVIGNRWF